jgi:hypothetical protein
MGLQGAFGEEEEEADEEFLPEPIKRSHKAKWKFPCTKKSQKQKQVNRRNLEVLNAVRQEAAADPLRKAQASLWAFSALTSGAGFHQEFLFASLLNVPVPSSRAFYYAQPGIARESVTMAHDSMSRAAACMPPGSTVSFDGAWSHARRSRQCIGCFVHLDRGKPRIIDYDTYDWYHGKPGEEIAIASQAMEGVVFQKLAERWQYDPRLTGLVHDQDAKLACIRKELEWDITELFDKNHVTKSWEKVWQTHAYVQKPEAKTKSWPLNRLKKGLQMWWFTCVAAEVELPERGVMWPGAVRHCAESRAALVMRMQRPPWSFLSMQLCL